MAEGFDFSELSQFAKDVLAVAQEFEKGKPAKKFLRQQANKLNKENKKQASKITNEAGRKIGKKTGNFMKGFKVGKVYKYKGQDLSIRAYNAAPHAHLLDLGHVVVRGGKRGKGGEEVGFAEGYHFMDKAKKGFEEGHYKDIEDFIDDILDKGL